MSIISPVLLIAGIEKASSIGEAFFIAASNMRRSGKNNLKTT